MIYCPIIDIEQEKTLADAESCDSSRSDVFINLVSLSLNYASGKVMKKG